MSRPCLHVVVQESALLFCFSTSIYLLNVLHHVRESTGRYSSLTLAADCIPYPLPRQTCIYNSLPPCSGHTSRSLCNSVRPAAALEDECENVRHRRVVEDLCIMETHSIGFSPCCSRFRARRAGAWCCSMRCPSCSPQQICCGQEIAHDAGPIDTYLGLLDVTPFVGLQRRQLFVHVITIHAIFIIAIVNHLRHGECSRRDVIATCGASHSVWELTLACRCSVLLICIECIDLRRIQLETDTTSRGTLGSMLQWLCATGDEDHLQTMVR